MTPEEIARSLVLKPSEPFAGVSLAQIRESLDRPRVEPKKRAVVKTDPGNLLEPTR